MHTADSKLTSVSNAADHLNTHDTHFILNDNKDWLLPVDVLVII